MTGMETLVSAAVAAQVARKIADYAEEEIKLCCSFHGDLKHMKKTLSNMQPQLKRAEDNSFGSDRESVREWLRLMKSVAYDIEDILDEYYYRNPSEQFDEICCIACARKVPLLCSMSMSNPALTRICMVHKMKTERQRLQKELAAPDAYGFHEIINSPGNNFEEKETTSQANGTAIIGRDKDVENIMAMVRVKKYMIITILGAVGLGKTSLAQLVYNHDETSKIFKTQKIWIHVPKGKASLKYIGTYMISRDGGKIHENMTEEDIMNGVGVMLNNYDSYLIVLDGLWSARENALQKLKEMLAKGSKKNVKVIVTTHSEKVAALMATRNLPAYKLDTLPEASIMTIFSQRAMASADEMEIITQHPLFSDMFKQYGKKIIERCEGTPLVANFLGSVINSGRMSRQWGDYWAPASIEEMWKVEEDFDNNRCNISLFLPSLKPIYYNMHNELRLCFVYISIFPKGAAIDKKKLIQQWIALNMIEPSRHGNLRPEETAEDYIEQLKEMYFLQITAQHSPVNEKVLHVHNLAYELARSVGSKDILVISDATTKKEAKQSSCNHDYRYSHDYRYAQLSTPVLLSVDPKNSINKARSLILKTLESERSFVSQVISENKYLRVLDLSGCSICELPDCIFKLKHLRYLDASGLPITIIPPELGNLVKLETLDISGTNLTLVPSSISSLKVLKYLNLKGCQNLQQLHSLDELHELCYLNLSDCLCVGNLPRSLQELKNLCFLNLADVHILPEGLLQSVESLTSLEDLILSGLELQTLPDIFGQLSSLRFLNLSRCSTLQQLPQSLFDLQSLKGLDLSFCSGIEEITESFGRLYSLTSLNLSGCCSLRILPTNFGDLIHLEELNLSECTALAKLPLSFRRLEHLHVLKLSRCGHLIEQVNHLTNSLEHLELTSCQDINLQSNLFSYLTRLRILDLSNCSQMEIVIGTPANLEVLVLANVALPLDLNFLTQLQNLHKLDITDATLSTAALSNLKHILGCMPMLKSVDTNNLDVYSILPSRIKISRVMDSLTGVESSNVRDRENTDGRQTTSVVEAGGPNTSAEGSDLVGHSSSSSEEITEDTSVENANRDLTSSTNSDATKVDALEDYANSNVNGEPKLQDCEHQARPINYWSSSSISSGSKPSASSSGTSTLDSNFKTEGPATHCKEDEISVLG